MPMLRDFKDYRINIQCLNRECQYIRDNLERATLPQDVEISDLEKRLKCPKCGHVGGKVFFNSDPRQFRRD